MNPKRVILHCVTSLHADGAQHMLLKLAAAVDRRRFEFKVISLRPGGPIRERLERIGVETFDLGIGRSPIAAAASVVKLKRAIDRMQPDVLQGWMYHGNLLLTLSRPLIKKRAPLLWNVRRALYDIREDKPLTRQVIRFNARLSSAPARIIYCGAAVAAHHEAVGFRPDRSVVIPNGFELDRFQPSPETRARLRQSLELPDDAVAVGMVGRYHPQKDHANFLRMAEIVSRRAPQVRFVLVGRGVDEQNAHLVRLSREHGLEGRVRFLGERSDVSEILSALDVFCLSSQNEGFPNVVGEAMSCGVPCVVTDAGAAGEVVGDTGIVVPRRDHESLARGVLSMLEMPSSGRSALGERARARIQQHFALDTIVKKYEAEYERTAL